MERVATAPLEENAVLAQEASYWHQMAQAVSDGRSPVAESSEQIAYLRSVARHRAGGGVPALITTHMLQTVSDPAFHRSAAELGDSTYAPRAFLWPELGRGVDPVTTPADQLDGLAAYRNALLDRLRATARRNCSPWPGWWTGTTSWRRCRRSTRPRAARICAT